MNVSILNTANRLKIGETQENYSLILYILNLSTIKNLFFNSMCVSFSEAVKMTCLDV